MVSLGVGPSCGGGVSVILALRAAAPRAVIAGAGYGAGREHWVAHG
jgi:hypothetical protein